MVAVQNADNKIFIVYILALVKLMIIPIYFSYKAQITLLINIEISIKYSNFLNIFSSDFAAELLEYTRIKNYPIDLLDSK